MKTKSCRSVCLKTSQCLQMYTFCEPIVLKFGIYTDKVFLNTLEPTDLLYMYAADDN